MSENAVKVLLDESQSLEIKKHVLEVTLEGIVEAKKQAGIDKPFLKTKQMAEYLGISYGTLVKFKKLGMPVIVVDTMEMYSKNECSKWLLNHQK